MASPGQEIIRRALDDLKQNISLEDGRTFENSNLQEVWNLVRQVQREQIERDRLQNVRRIEPVLRLLETYAGVMDTFCQGFSPMAWVWGPIKLILTLARQYSNVLEKILEAYKSIAEHLPRIDKLQATFRDDESFQIAVGFMYKNIAEFHQRVYRFFRRRGWAVLFAFDWGFFERRFNSLLTNMAYRFDLVDREAAAVHFADMKKARDLDLREYEKEEIQRKSAVAQAVYRWLSAAEDPQEEYLVELADKRQPGTCNWILEQEVMRSWVEPTEIEPLVWLTGKPGGGKSVLASFIIQHLQSRKESTVLYYFCAVNSNQITCADLLRTMAFQALQQNPDLASLVHEAYLQKVSTRSTPKMKSMLKDIFAAAKFVHVVIDGVDECVGTIQQELLRALSEIQRKSEGLVKILVSSRLERQISEPLPTKAHISLNGQTDGAVQLYIGQKIQEILEFFPNISKALLSRIEKRMLDMAKGMFLWVYLVTAMLKDRATEHELEEAVEQLPEGLEAVYGRILDRLKNLKDPVRTRAYRILSWSCAASRAVKVQEVADGVVLQPGHASVLNEKTRIGDVERNIVDICAPLVEKTTAGYLEIVHFSAKEFLLDRQSGPFIGIAQAHFDLGFSCLSSLTASFIVLPRLSPQTTITEIETLMVGGHFGLHSYAHEFWASHVTDYFREINAEVGAPPATHDPKILINLLENFRRIQKGVPVRDVDDPPLQSLNLSTSPITLLHFPQILNLIQEWENFRNHNAGAESYADTIEAQMKLQLHQDPTFLSLIAQHIRSTKENLLKLDLNNLPDHINLERFTAFRREVGSDAFECRYRTCNSWSSSLQQRLEHEKGHSPSFPCLHCDFSGKGFDSRRDLENHVKLYHSSEKEVTVPERLSSSDAPGASLRKRPFPIYDAALPFRDSGCWNEKGRKAVQKTFAQVYKALAPHPPHFVGDDGLSDTPDNGTYAFSEGSATTYSKIGEKIALQQYQSLREFKDDVSYYSRSAKRAKLSDDKDCIEEMLDGALSDAAKAFPGFACSIFHDPSDSNVTSFSTTGSEMDCETITSQVSPPDNEMDQIQIQLSPKPAFWSKLEEDELPKLLTQYGSDFDAIADFLKTKTAEDVEKHFQALVKSGRHDLEILVHRVPTGLSARQQEEETFHTLDSASFNSATKFAPNQFMMPPAASWSEVAQPQLPVSDTLYLASCGFSTHLNSPYASVPAPERLGVPGAETAQESPRDAEPNNLPKKYKRNAPSPAYCQYCTPGPAQFRDESTLLKHIQRSHAPLRKVWVCIDVSMDRTFLSNQWKTWGHCFSCCDGKRYGSKHNAATHLRKKHFGPATSMETLIRWMEEIEEPNPNHPDYRFGGPSTRSREPPGVSIRTALRKDRTTRMEDPEDDAFGTISSARMSFDDILGNNDGDVPLEDSATPLVTDLPRTISASYLAAEGLIRVDQVHRLPNLSENRKAITRDQVAAYYETLDHLQVGSVSYKDALANLKRLSRTLREDFMDWQRDLSAAEVFYDLRDS